MARKARKKNLTHRWRENGVQRRATFKTSAEKVAFVWQLEQQKKNGASPPEVKPVTFGEAYEIFVERHVKVKRRDRSAREDRALFNRYLKSAFGHQLLNDLCERSLEDFRAAMQARRLKNGRPLSPTTINLALVLAKGVMRRAHKWKLCSANPWEDVSLIPQQETQFDFWTVDERDRFLTWAKSRNEPLWKIVTVAVYAGLRKSELWALHRSAVDLHGRLIHVRASVDHTTGQRLELTKNRKLGTVPMAAPVYEALKDCVFMPADAPVFDQKIFWHISQLFRSYCREAGVREIRFHDLRHTYASHLVQAGVPIYEVQKLMRHRSIQMTERYAKLRMDTLSAAVDKLVLLSKAARSESADCAHERAHGGLQQL